MKKCCKTRNQTDTWCIYMYIHMHGAYIYIYTYIYIYIYINHSTLKESVRISYSICSIQLNARPSEKYL